MKPNRNLQESHKHTVGYLGYEVSQQHDPTNWPEITVKIMGQKVTVTLPSIQSIDNFFKQFNWGA